MSNLCCPGIDTSLWETIQNKIIDNIKLNIDGSLEEVISESNKYIIHYQDTFGTLCEMTMNKKQFWLNTIPADLIIKIIEDFDIYYIWNNDKIEFTLDLNGIQTKCCNKHCYLSYKEIEKRFIQKLEINHKLKLKLYQEGEEQMEPYVNILNNQAMCCDSYTSYSSPITDNKQTIYQNKKVSIKYQLLVKDLLHIDTKFINRFFKDVKNGCINLYNYENDKAFTLTSFIDGVDRKYHTIVRDEEEAIAYEYVISNSKEFIEWVNQLKTYSLEDYVNVNKVSPDYNLRDVVYYVSRPATLDDRIFNEIWDILTPEQKTNYLIKNVEKQNLICKGTITNLKVGLVEKGSLCSYDNTIYYTIYDFNTGREVVIEEKHIFNNTNDAVSYLVNDCIEKNKKD